MTRRPSERHDAREPSDAPLAAGTERPTPDATACPTHETNNALAGTLVNLELLRAVLGEASAPLGVEDRALCLEAVDHALRSVRALTAKVSG